MRITANSEAIRVLMARRNWTMVRLEQESGLSGVTLRRLLNGEPFRTTTIEQLAATFGCQPMDLIVQAQPAERTQPNGLR